LSITEYAGHYEIEKAASGGLAVAAEINLSYGGIMINPQLKKAIPANSEGGIALRKNSYKSERLLNLIQ
jgi:hypothetical protein